MKRSEYDRARYAANAEAERARVRAYGAANRARILARQRARREAERFDMLAIAAIREIIGLDPNLP